MRDGGGRPLRAAGAGPGGVGRLLPAVRGAETALLLYSPSQSGFAATGGVAPCTVEGWRPNRSTPILSQSERFRSHRAVAPKPTRQEESSSRAVSQPPGGGRGGALHEYARVLLLSPGGALHEYARVLLLSPG